MDAPLTGGPGAFAAALAALDAELDWELLEGLYCWDEGSGFFAPDQRAASLDAGVQIAAALAEPLAGLPDGGPRRSLYVGAAVAELPPMLCELLVLGRTVHALNLPGPEVDELNRAFAASDIALRIETGYPDDAFDHLWVVSVLSDPEAFPALHDALYQRSGTRATGRGDLAQERQRADGLVQTWCAGIAPPAVLSTTDEELGFFEAECARRGWRLDVPDVARLSGIVGDPVRHCALG